MPHAEPSTPSAAVFQSLPRQPPQKSAAMFFGPNSRWSRSCGSECRVSKISIIISWMVNKFSVEVFKQLRVYRRFSLPLILNDMACNRLMKLTFFVDNAPLIYRYACRLIGRNFVNELLNSTYCKVFTAGNTIEEADRASEYFRAQGIAVILDYCAEGDIHNAELESSLDENASLFARSAQQIQHQAREMISIKITGLLDMRVLKRLNDGKELRDRLWKTQNQEGWLTYEGLLQGLQKIYAGVSEEQVEQYLKTIHNYQGAAHQFKISELDFKINHHPYYIFEADKNEDFVVRLFLPLEVAERQKLKNFNRRVVSICEPFADNKNDFRILVDAEQSYVQKGIESISEQLQERYNQRRAYILPTIQNYLKRSVQRAHYEIQLAKQRKLVFGAKLVRGAYIVEETRLAREQGYENPVVDCFDKTTDNYLASFEAMVSQFPEGEVIVATHNIDTIESTLAIKKKYARTPTVSFAQLLGLADHLTWKLKQDNHTVYKYLPWAQTEVMVPYMIRRGQELNQMKYPLDLQYQLLKHELWSRLVQ